MLDIITITVINWYYEIDLRILLMHFDKQCIIYFPDRREKVIQII